MGDELVFALAKNDGLVLVPFERCEVDDGEFAIRGWFCRDYLKMGSFHSRKRIEKAVPSSKGHFSNREFTRGTLSADRTGRIYFLVLGCS
jgi:hypothetical protein